MPIYEYVCDACGHEFEEFTRSINEGIRLHCPSCGNPSLKTKFSLPTVIYKGAGFATTEARGITGHKRRPKIKVGMKSDLSPAEQERMK